MDPNRNFGPGLIYVYTSTCVWMVANEYFYYIEFALKGVKYDVIPRRLMSAHVDVYGLLMMLSQGKGSSNNLRHFLLID